MAFEAIVSDQFHHPGGQADMIWTGHEPHDTVAVLGTGIMGAPMARNLAARRARRARVEPHAREGRGRSRAAARGSPTRRPRRPRAPTSC